MGCQKAKRLGQEGSLSKNNSSLAALVLSPTSCVNQASYSDWQNRYWHCVAGANLHPSQIAGG
jgi:hypothetical protein